VGVFSEHSVVIKTDYIVAAVWSYWLGMVLQNYLRACSFRECGIFWANVRRSTAWRYI